MGITVQHVIVYIVLVSYGKSLENEHWRKVLPLFVQSCITMLFPLGKLHFADLWYKGSSISNFLFKILHFTHLRIIDNIC